MKKSQKKDDVHYGVVSAGLITIPLFFALIFDAAADDLSKSPYADTTLFDVGFLVCIAFSTATVLYWGLFRKVLGFGGFMGEKGTIATSGLLRYATIASYLLIIAWLTWYAKLQ